MTDLYIHIGRIAESDFLGRRGIDVKTHLIIHDEGRILRSIDLMDAVQGVVEEGLGQCLVVYVAFGKGEAEVGVLHIDARGLHRELLAFDIEQVDEATVLERLDIVHHRRARGLGLVRQLGDIESAGYLLHQ